jgi:hypothetical protein
MDSKVASTGYKFHALQKYCHPYPIVSSFIMISTIMGVANLGNYLTNKQTKEKERERELDCFHDEKNHIPKKPFSILDCAHNNPSSGPTFSSMRFYTKIKTWHS